MITLRTRIAVVLGLAILTFGVASILGRAPGGDQRSAVPGAHPGTADPQALAAASTSAVPTLMTALQQRLREQPRDAQSWALLGLVYVEQARITANSTYYSKAAGALETSLELAPADNDTALAGLGALAAGRHDFELAAAYAGQAIRVNPESAIGYGVLSDAHTELGRYDEGLAAAQRMDDLRPGLPSLSRLAYHAELRGDVDGARALLVDALALTYAPGDVAYLNGLLGDLAWSTGDPSDAETRYAAAAAAEPGYVPAMFGSARVAAARGDLQRAGELAAVVAGRQPTIEHLVWYGELLDATGRHAEAHQQYELARAASDLQRSAGVAADLEVALLEADHGNPDGALSAAAAALDARPSVYAEDAYAWALHAAGRHEEALRWATRASRLGTPSALLAYHKGAIEEALGMTAAAEIDFARALDLNPVFSMLYAPHLTAVTRGAR